MTTQMLAPPSTALRPTAWLRQNLFSGLLSSLLTVLLAALLVWLVINVGQADWPRCGRGDGEAELIERREDVVDPG